MSIRIKLTIFMSMLIVSVSVICCTIFYLHDKNEHSKELIKFGSSLVSLLSQDNDVKLAITANQPAFLELPIKSAYSYDVDKEVAYWKVMNKSKIIKEEKSFLYDLQLQDIPGRSVEEGDTDEIKIKLIKMIDGKTFYDISVPVKEKRMLTEEEFAAQVFGEEQRKSIIGFVQIGLSTHVLNKALRKSFLSVIFPVSMCILFGGFCIVIFLNKYFINPIKNIADVSLEIARGNLNKRLKVYTQDEIGALTNNFNQMTFSLEKSYKDLKQEISQHKYTANLLQHQLNIEELIATISTNFINYVSDEINTVINSSLLTIGEFLDVDRVFLFLYRENNAYVTNTNEWRRDQDEVISWEAKPRNISINTISLVIQSLQKNEVIAIKAIKELSVDLKSEMRFLGSENTKSIIIVSLKYGNNLIGFLECEVDKEEKDWSHHDISLLKVISEIFTNALEHKRKEQMLKSAHDELENRVKERTVDLLNTNKKLEKEITERIIATKALQESESRLKLLIDRMPVGCILWNTDFKVVLWNPACEHIFGYSIDEATGKHPYDLIVPKNEINRVENIWLRLVQGDSMAHSINENVTRDGRTIICDWKNTPLLGNDGSVIGVLSMVMDITDRKKAEDSLKKYEILFSEIHDLPYICDDKGNILFVNKTFERLTGHKPQEFLGKSFASLFDEENLKLANEVYTKTLQGESPGYELYFKDTGILCEYKNLPLKDEKGNIIGVIGTARDITERKNMITALEQAKNFAESLIETANVMVIGMNKDGTIQIINKTVEELTGYTKTELIGQNFFDILVPKGRYHYFWDVFRRWSSGKGNLLKVIENPIITKTGLERYISWQNSEIMEHEVAVGSISFGIDITEQKLMNTLVERMRLTSIIKDISMVFNQGVQLKDKLKKCTETLVENLHADCTGLWMLNNKDDLLELKAYEGNFVDIEKKYGQIPYGKTNIGLIAKNTMPYITNNFIDAVKTHSNELEEKGETISFAGFPLASEGRVFGVVALFTKRELNNFVVRALASVTDIISLGIDRERNVDALRISENKYRVLLENLPQKVFHKDRESVYVSCNKNYASDVGITPEEIKGKTDYDFFPKALAEKYRMDDQRIMKSGIPEEFEEKYLVEGKEYFIQTVKTPIKDETGKITGILGIFWDITEKIQLQMEATRSRHMASLGELAAGVAHEINNPINGIINYAQILANKSSEQSKEKDIANRIKKESIRIANIVKSLLSFARPGEFHNIKKSVHVEEILTDTFILTEAQLCKEGIEIKLNLPKTLPEITVNAQQIQQVFLNLLNNARYALNVKYKGGHEKKIIEISGEKITKNNVPYIRITFVDLGIGIPSNMLDKVVDPFFTLKPKGIGTGLGLSICHRIINEHGGKFTIESVEGEYTKVIILLPSA